VNQIVAFERDDR